MTTTTLKEIQERDALVEFLAKEIHLYSVCHPDYYAQICGEKQKEWKTDAPWDTNPNELTEWQRDDYRRMARAVIAKLSGLGKL